MSKTANFLDSCELNKSLRAFIAQRRALHALERQIQIANDGLSVWKCILLCTIAASPGSSLEDLPELCERDIYAIEGECHELAGLGYINFDVMSGAISLTGRGRERVAQILHSD